MLVVDRCRKRSAATRQAIADFTESSIVLSFIMYAMSATYCYNFTVHQHTHLRKTKTNQVTVQCVLLIEKQIYARVVYKTRHLQGHVTLCHSDKHV